MDSAAPSEQSPLVQPKKSRRFVAGALAASLVLGLLAVTSARSSGGLRAAFYENPCMDNCKDVCGAKGVSGDANVAVCDYRTRPCGRPEDPRTVCDCEVGGDSPWAKMACCSLDGRLDGKVTKKCTKGNPCSSDYDVCSCACNL